MTEMGSELPCGGAAPILVVKRALAPTWMMAASPEQARRLLFEPAIANLHRAGRELVDTDEVDA